MEAVINMKGDYEAMEVHLKVLPCKFPTELKS
jgi:hypothetical protein